MPKVFVAKAAEFADGDRALCFTTARDRVFHWQGITTPPESCLHQGGPSARGVIMHKVEDVLGPDKPGSGKSSPTTRPFRVPVARL